MREQLDRYRKELQSWQEKLKESKDFDEKLEALVKVSEYSALYLEEVYREDSLYDYRRLEKMAREMVYLNGEKTDQAKRYHEMGQDWRANVGINSVGLDFYIIQSAAEEILVLSGKYEYELAESLTSSRVLLLLKKIRKKIKELKGHDKKDFSFSVREVVEELGQPA